MSVETKQCYLFRIEHKYNFLTIITCAEKTIDAINNICSALKQENNQSYVYFTMEKEKYSQSVIREYYEKLNPFVICDLIQKTDDFEIVQQEVNELYELSENEQLYTTYLSVLFDD